MVSVEMDDKSAKSLTRALTALVGLTQFAVESESRREVAHVSLDIVWTECPECVLSITHAGKMVRDLHATNRTRNVLKKLQTSSCASANQDTISLTANASLLIHAKLTMVAATRMPSAYLTEWVQHVAASMGSTAMA
jgi:hypothetical protein